MATVITRAWKRGSRRRRDATPSPIRSMTPRFWWRAAGTRRPCPLPFTEMTPQASWGRPRLIELRLPFGPLHSCAAVRLTETHSVRTSRATVGTSALRPGDLSPAHESGTFQSRCPGPRGRRPLSHADHRSRSGCTRTSSAPTHATGPPRAASATRNKFLLRIICVLRKL
jgi:hypothetical protein